MQLNYLFFSSLMAAEVSNHENSETLQRIISSAPKHQVNSTNSITRRWKTELEQQIYSSRLLQALRRVGPNSSTPVRSSVARRKVRETADRVLAVTAKGRSWWSRAILSKRLRLKLKKSKQVVRRLHPRREGKSRTLPTVPRKVKVLGRLVPGGRKLSLPNLLEETTDYIAALEMQVRAMTALAELLTAPQATS